MNVALYLSGLTRSVSYAWPLIERYLVRPFGSKIFLHTWDIDHGGARYGCTMKGEVPAPSITDGRTKKQFIEEEIKPASYLIENYGEWTALNPGPVPKAMYYGIHKAKELRMAYEKKHLVSFDMVIRSRMDVFYESFMIEQEIQDILNNKQLIYVCLPGNKPDPRFITDIFGFGSTNAMDVYADTYLINDFSRPGEVCLQYQLESKRISCKWSSMKYRITNEWTASTVKLWGDF